MESTKAAMKIKQSYYKQTLKNKRLNTVLKNAKELSILCGIDVCALIYVPDSDKPLVYPEKPEDLNRVLTRYTGKVPKTGKVGKKAETARCIDVEMDNLSLHQLEQMIGRLDLKIGSVNERIDSIKRFRNPAGIMIEGEGQAQFGKQEMMGNVDYLSVNYYDEFFADLFTDDYGDNAEIGNCSIANDIGADFERVMAKDYEESLKKCEILSTTEEYDEIYADILTDDLDIAKYMTLPPNDHLGDSCADFQTRNYGDHSIKGCQDLAFGSNWDLGFAYNTLVS